MGTSVTLTCIVGAVHKGLGVRKILLAYSHTLWELNRAKCSGLFVSLTPMVGNPLIGASLLRYGSESRDLLVQFTLAPQGSQIGACIVQHLLTRAWIGAILVLLIRPRA